ncbi:hypothetical protein CVT26_013738 [Gymnopilus dilepis]|uniref:Uncharacterized protein n=1 Tax=Gymnopilus dilepis TaxID=231916 RepID=A0A409YWQ2_9AGAR|nr:hypothetical protein CVT26_013738 [Gymnopilus dilepis]
MSSRWKGQSRVLKEACKLSSNAKAATANIPGAAQAVADFKKWHSLHLNPLRHAAICALDLGHNPAALDDNILFVEVKLKANHKELPPKRKYEPVAGFILTMSETREMLENLGGNAILDTFKTANEHMRTKGGLGVAVLMLKAHDIVDLVKIILPSPSATKHVQENDNWGGNWLEKLRIAVEMD